MQTLTFRRAVNTVMIPATLMLVWYTGGDGVVAVVNGSFNGKISIVNFFLLAVVAVLFIMMSREPARLSRSFVRVRINGFIGYLWVVIAIVRLSTLFLLSHHLDSFPMKVFIDVGELKAQGLLGKRVAQPSTFAPNGRVPL